RHNNALKPTDTRQRYRWVSPFLAHAISHFKVLRSFVEKQTLELKPKMQQGCRLARLLVIIQGILFEKQKLPYVVSANREDFFCFIR
ncbi:MAG: hypothetical protein IKL16_07140, partial [Clostridia bacterium]|nr:hypothetical protein [Clostridia bacterium]